MSAVLEGNLPYLAFMANAACKVKITLIISVSLCGFSQGLISYTYYTNVLAQTNFQAYDY